MAFSSRNIHLIDSDDELDDEVCIGCYRGDIVGIRYYRGSVNNGEMVSLNREPHNPYDRNAVRVDNVYGVQVGHIKRDLAKALADVLDNRLVRLEGIVPFGKNNMYHMPCDLTFWGTPENEQQVLQKMRYHGYTLTTHREPIPSKSGLPLPSHRRYGGFLAPAASKISQEKMRDELGQLFDTMGEKDKTVTTEAAEVIKTKLYQHQKQALAWMIARETCKDLPPFWEERTQNGRKEYFNTATNYTASKKPACVLGGILADDMGLGKTLEVICLIVTNFHKGKPLVTLKDSGTGKSKTLKQKSRRTLKRTTVKKPQKKKQDLELVSDEEKEEEEEELDTDDEVHGDEPIVMTWKVDPDFKPMVEVTVVEETNLRRSSRSQKKPARYIEVGSSDDEGVEMCVPSPPKKQKKRPVRKEKKVVPGSSDDEEVKSVSSPKKQKKRPVGKEKKIVPNTNPVSSVSSPCSSSATDPTSSTTSALATQLDEIKVITSPPHSRKSLANLGPRPTLVVCPLSVISNWESQFESHVHPNLLNIYTYYGQDRTKDKTVLEDQDVVITTYQTLASEYSKGKSPLISVKWLRVVLDEGHCIRNPNALMTKAAHALTSERRWVVTGTPIQNSMKDLWSIICFLKLEPFMDRQWWRRTVERPVAEGDESALCRVQALMRNIAMRRTKTQQVDGKPLVELPARQVYIQPIELSLEERKLYDAMAKEGRLVIGKYYKAGTMVNNYADVLAILMRLRQLCCHPKLCANAFSAATASSASGTPEELQQRLISTLMTILATGVDEECSVCLDSLLNPVITHCAHVFCRPCIESVIKIMYRESPRCPLCRAHISSDQLVEVPPQVDEDAVDSDEWQTSSKVDALMSELVKLRSTDPSIKSVVISQFTSMLSVVEIPLTAAGFSFLRLDGSMSQSKRSQVIEDFDDRSSQSPTVLLLSMKAGGVGLNLTAASRVFLLDPAWNPAAEEQCFDRCHRLGQTRDVIITKFITKDSVEERMLDLQKKKKDLLAKAFKKTSAEERRKQRINDLKVLIDF